MKNDNGRGSSEEWIKEGKIRYELDTTLMQMFCIQSGETLVIRSGIQSGQFPPRGSPNLHDNIEV